MRKWHICISGFTQQEGDLTGLARLWMDLHNLHAGPDAVVELRTWNSNWQQLAERIWLVGQEQKQKPRVAIYAYSWGGGWGFTQLAKYLAQRGICVQVAILCEPVYCSPWLSFRWLALTRWRKVVAPANVKCVRWFYQRMNKPQSPGVVAANPDLTWLSEGQQLDREHQYADEAGLFQQSCRSAAEAL